MNVLVIAYACEPNHGSEPEVGWQWVLQMSKNHRLWVITRANNRGAIESVVGPNGLPNIIFEYVDPPRWLTFWKRKNFGIQVYYFVWQIWALVRGLQMNREKCFDYAHHLTFSPFYFPPLIALLPVPFVWGPVGAGEVLPPAYRALFTRGQRVREVLRIVVRRAAVFNPLVYFAMRKAALIIASTSETKAAFPPAVQAKVVVEPQIGMDLQSCSFGLLTRGATSDGIFRILTAGRHVYWKGHIVVVRAFAQLIARIAAPAELIILSDGPERPKLEAEVQRLGIEDSVHFLKWLPDRRDVFRQYEGADVFAYCSFFECGGYVVLEAMAHGTPVVSIALGGPGEIVSDRNGVLVKPAGVEETIKAFADAFEFLRTNREVLEKRRERVRTDIEERHAWAMKGARVAALIADRLCLPRTTAK